MGESLTWSKASHQTSSEPCGQSQQRKSEARGSEEAGRVMEPRNLYSGGYEDNCQTTGGKVDAPSSCLLRVSLVEFLNHPIQVCHLSVDQRKH